MDVDDNHIHNSIDLPSIGNKLLGIACKKGHPPIFQERLQMDEEERYIYNGSDPFAHDNALLIKACSHQYPPLIRALLR